MKKLKNKLFENPLMFGSLILFVGNMIANASSYFYHLLMGRMLGPVDYGILESLISLIYLFTIPVLAISIVIVKYVSQYKGENRPGAIGKFFMILNRKFLIYGLISLSGLLVLSPFINSFLHLKSIIPLLIVDVLAFTSVFLGMNRAFLQGILEFFPISVSVVLESIGKLILAVLFVLWGFSISGAIGSLLVTGILSLILSKYLLKDKIGKVDLRENLESRGMIKYAFPALISSLSMTSLYTTDILLARHFLSPLDAGYYSALGVLGKIIFFASGPIAMVMFPLVSESHANGKNYRKLFFQSFLFVLIPCMAISLGYFLFPNYILSILYGNNYLPAASYLGLFAIFISFYSLSNLFVNFFMSIKRVRSVIFPAAAAILQIILLSIFNQSLSELIIVSIIVNGLLLFSLVLYYFKK